jgi:hypothetical protein
VIVYGFIAHFEMLQFTAFYPICQVFFEFVISPNNYGVFSTFANSINCHIGKSANYFPQEMHDHILHALLTGNNFKTNAEYDISPPSTSDLNLTKHHC